MITTFLLVVMSTMTFAKSVCVPNTVNWKSDNFKNTTVAHYVPAILNTTSQTCYCPEWVSNWYTNGTVDKNCNVVCDTCFIYKTKSKHHKNHKHKHHKHHKHHHKHHKHEHIHEHIHEHETIILPPPVVSTTTDDVSETTTNIDTSVLETTTVDTTTSTIDTTTATETTTVDTTAIETATTSASMIEPRSDDIILNDVPDDGVEEDDIVPQETTTGISTGTQIPFDSEGDGDEGSVDGF
jgi:Zn-finger nucleic acid-binding protein